MPSEILTALITASGAVALAGVSYWFTKKKEREAELRKEKLEHYKEFAAALSGALQIGGSKSGRTDFAKACNKLNLIAPQAVLDAYREFQDRPKGTDVSPEEHDKLISKVFYEIRKDLAISPKDEETTFQIKLWSDDSRND